MKWTAPITAAALAVVTATAVVLPMSATPASAASVPFTDPSAKGAIGFCSQDNKPVTSGSLLTEPFVSKAVSTVPAPAGYTEAWLVLVQPIEHEDPSIWTPYDMTGDATFSNPQHPAAQSITIDPPLLEPDHSLPPYWDGYYQLRMYFAAPEKEPAIDPYPAAVIRVKGKNWSLVSGGKVDCAGSSAVSELSSELPKSVVDTPQTIVVGGKNAAPPTTAKKTGTTIPASATTPTATTPATTTPGTTRPGSQSATGSAATGTPPKAPSRPVAAAAGTGSSGGDSAWWIALVAAAVVLAGVAATFARRRFRRSART